MAKKDYPTDGEYFEGYHPQSNGNLAKSGEYHNGNYTKIDEVPYKPLPEVAPPGTVRNPQEGRDYSRKSDVHHDEVEHLRGWNEQNQL